MLQKSFGPAIMIGFCKLITAPCMSKTLAIGDGKTKSMSSYGPSAHSAPFALGPDIEGGPIMPFQLVEVRSGGAIVPVEGEPLQYDGAVAASAARAMSAGTGKRIQPRPVDDGEDWRQRERERFEDGTYERPVWAHCTWADPDAADNSPIRDHFAHISRRDPSMIAFVEDGAKGAADRHTQMSPGRYLMRFFGERLSERSIRHWAREHEATAGLPELKLAWSADEIECVYEEGPRSCMSEGAARFDSDPWHPARAYAAGDLAVAYIEPNPDDERITARAVVWPEKGIYVQAYGDLDMMRRVLVQAGYVPACGFEGAHLLRIEAPDDATGGYVVPYIDGAVQAASDGGRTLVIEQGGDIALDVTNGVSVSEPRGPWCDHCNEHHDEDEADAMVRVEPGETWCEWAAQERAWQCEATGNYFACMSDTVVLVDGRRWSWTYAMEHGVVCEECNTVHEADDTEPERAHGDDDAYGRHYCERCREDGVPDLPPRPDPDDPRQGQLQIYGALGFQRVGGVLHHNDGNEWGQSA